MNRPNFGAAPNLTVCVQISHNLCLVSGSGKTHSERKTININKSKYLVLHVRVYKYSFGTAKITYKNKACQKMKDLTKNIRPYKKNIGPSTKYKTL